MLHNSTQADKNARDSQEHARAVEGTGESLVLRAPRKRESPRVVFVSVAASLLHGGVPNNRCVHIRTQVGKVNVDPESFFNWFVQREREYPVGFAIYQGPFAATIYVHHPEMIKQILSAPCELTFVSLRSGVLILCARMQVVRAVGMFS